MATDALQAARAHVDAVFSGLDLSGVTAAHARAMCDQALATLASNCDLMTRFERPRQDKVRADRAAAAAKQAAETAKAEAEKKARELARATKREARRANDKRMINGR